MLVITHCLCVCEVCLLSSDLRLKFKDSLNESKLCGSVLTLHEIIINEVIIWMSNQDSCAPGGNNTWYKTITILNIWMHALFLYTTTQFASFVIPRSLSEPGSVTQLELCFSLSSRSHSPSCRGPGSRSPPSAGTFWSAAPVSPARRKGHSSSGPASRPWCTVWRSAGSHPPASGTDLRQWCSHSISMWWNIFVR